MYLKKVFERQKISFYYISKLLFFENLVKIFWNGTFGVEFLGPLPKVISTNFSIKSQWKLGKFLALCNRYLAIILAQGNLVAKNFLWGSGCKFPDGNGARKTLISTPQMTIYDITWTLPENSDSPSSVTPLFRFLTLT